MRGVRTDGKRILSARKSSRLTQEQVAALADCDVKTYRKAERSEDRLDLRVVVDIARALKVELEQIVLREDQSPSHTKQNIEVAHEWIKAFYAADLDGLLSLHTTDTILEVPGTEDLPEGGNYFGLDEVRGHLTRYLQTFRQQVIREENLEIHAADDHVFVRTTATVEYVPAGQSYTTRQLNELRVDNENIHSLRIFADTDAIASIIGKIAPERSMTRR